MSKKEKTRRTRNKKTFLYATLLASLAYCGLHTPDAYGVNASGGRIFRALANSSYDASGIGSGYSWNVSGVSSGADVLYVRSQSSDVYSALDQHEELAAGISPLKRMPDPDKPKPDGHNGRDASGVLRDAGFQTYYYSFNGKTSINNGLVDVETYRSDDYIQSRIGGMGFVSWRDRQGSGVVLHAGYGRGHMSQSYDSSHEFGVLGDFVEAEDIEAKIRLTDFQFGVTFHRQFDNGVLASLRFDGGAQDYGWARNQEQILTYDENRNETVSQVYQAALTGNTFKASFTLSKEYDFHNGWTMRPLASIESACSWIFAGVESGTDFSDLIKDGEMRDIWKPWQLNDTLSYCRNMARVGSILAYDDEGFGIYAQAFYATQLGGRAAPFVSISDVAGTEGAQVEGQGFGRDSLQVGVGTRVALDSANRSSIAGNYDVFCYERGTGQTISAIFKTAF